MELSENKKESLEKMIKVCETKNQKRVFNIYLESLEDLGYCIFEYKQLIKTKWGYLN